jgi:DNA-binding NarL/FixJ family response regulator
MHRLTERQRAIAQAIVEGLSNKAIARNLVCSEYTVRDHVSVMLRKFGVANRVQLAAVLVLRLSASRPAAAFAAHKVFC